MSADSVLSHLRSRLAHAGETVTVRGWVTHVRSSAIAFAVIRDGTGICQTVFVKNQLPGSMGAVRTPDDGNVRLHYGRGAYRSAFAGRRGSRCDRPHDRRHQWPGLSHPAEGNHCTDFLKLDNRHPGLYLPRASVPSPPSAAKSSRPSMTSSTSAASCASIRPFSPRRSASAPACSPPNTSRKEHYLAQTGQLYASQRPPLARPG